MKANLSQVATYESMQPLAIPGQAEGLLERAGREPTTHPEALADRQGYDPGFLDGWEILLPLATGPRKNDMRRVRRGGGGVELRYTHFSVLMSTSRRLPMLTAVNIDASQSRKVPRIQSWSFDGRLDEGDQFGDALYDGNDLDRGHMVRREDPVWGDEEEARLANEDTFHFTNSCPQMAQVNQQIWLGLENYILKHARVDKMRVSVPRRRRHEVSECQGAESLLEGRWFRARRWPPFCDRLSRESGGSAVGPGVRVRRLQDVPDQHQGSDGQDENRLLGSGSLRWLLREGECHGVACCHDP
jgi:hypothetical protein